MPKLTTIENTSVSPLRTQAPQVRVSVTPEQIAGPEVRLLTELGKKADEVTAFVVKRQNTKDLEIVTRADTAMKEVLLEQRLAAEKRRGIDASGLLTEQHELFDSNMQPKDGQVVTPAHQRYLDVYESADPRQQRAMDLQKNKQRLVHLKAIGSYEEAQTADAALKAHKANVEISVAKGIAATTQEELDLELSSIYRSFDSIKSLTGAEASTVQAEQMKKISAIHTGRLENLINAKDIVGAEEYFKKYKADMIGDTSEMQKAIASRKVDVLSEVEADKAFKLWVGGKTTQAYNDIDKIKDPDVQKGARSELDARIRNEQSDRAEKVYRANRDINAAMFQKDDNGNYTVKSFSDMPQGALNYLAGQPEGLAAVTKIKNFFAVRDNPAEPSTETQMKTYDTLIHLAKSQNPAERQKFLEYNVATSSTLGESYKKYFMDLQGELISKQPGSLIAKADVVGQKEGFYGLGADGYEKVRFALQGQLNKSVLAEEEREKRKLTPNEYSDLADKVYETGKVQKLKNQFYAPTPPKPGKQVQPIDAHIKDSIDLYKITDDEDKSRFTSKLYATFDKIRDTNIAGGKASEPSWKQREAVIKFAAKDKVFVDEFGRNPSEIAITLNDEEAETAYVETAGGNEVLIKEIDAVQGESLKRLDDYIVEKNLTYSYQDRANALEALGNKDVINRRRKSLTTGSIKTSGGNSMSREGIITALSRNDVATLKSESTRDAMVSKYGKEILPVLNFVIREKERAAQ